MTCLHTKIVPVIFEPPCIFLDSRSAVFELYFLLLIRDKIVLLGYLVNFTLVEHVWVCYVVKWRPYLFLLKFVF